MLEEVIISSSEHQFAQLYPRAKKAAQDPKIGVKIVNPYAEFVIRDCARVAVQYLPIFLYGIIQDPITTYKGKFTQKDIIDFVSRAGKDISVRQLLRLMLVSVQKHLIDQNIKVSEIPTKQEPVKTPLKDSVYGDYGDDDLTGAQMQEEPVKTIDLMMLSEKDMANKLIEAFEAK